MASARAWGGSPPEGQNAIPPLPLPPPPPPPPHCRTPSTLDD
ncbi:hypothetical protein [Bordetella pertussis]